jgi:hypothetical protein
MAQVARPIILDLPELFKVELDRYIQENPPNWKYQHIYFYYLIHYLTVRQIQEKNKEKEDEFFSINTKNLKKVTIWNIDRYILYLVNGEFLMRDNYIKGEKSYHYKLKPRYLHGHCQVKIEQGTEFFNRIINDSRLKRSHANQEPEYLNSMRKLFMSIDFDYPAARSWIDSQDDETKKFLYHTALTQIEDKRFRYFKRNKTNYRLDTNMTNLKKDLRQFIKGDYEEIDLKNSQPFLFGVLLKEIKQENRREEGGSEGIPLCFRYLALDPIQWFGKQVFNSLAKIRQNGVFNENGEFLNFIESVNSGTFYDDFQKLYAGGNLSRKEIKDIIYKVFFSQNVIYEDKNKRRYHKGFVPYPFEKDQFASVYPIIYKIIKILKSKNHSKLSVFLQRVEARIFIDMLCLILVNLGIVPLTIHDSILVPAEQKDQALQICEDVFKHHFKVIPKFHKNPVRLK